MAIISFWGERHGQVATTSNLVAATADIVMNIPVKTMITHTHFNRSTLENSFKKRIEQKNGYLSYTDFGIEALERLAKSNRLSPEAIRNNTAPILDSSRLDLLYGVSNPSDNFGSNICHVLPQIFRTAEAYYDLTLIDVSSGTDNAITNTILELSDLIVVCLNQNTSVLNSYFIEKNYPKILDEKEHLIVLGNYNKRSKYTEKNIKRKYGIRNVYTVPHCPSLMDAINDSSVLEFYLRNRHIKRSVLEFLRNRHTEHENSFYFEEVRRFSKAIISHLGLKTEGHYTGGDNK